jgi:hypothetical protein
MERIDRRNTIALYQSAMLLTALRELAASLGGKHDFKASQDFLTRIQNLLFPDDVQVKENIKDKARRLLEMEHARGPMKVKSLDYGKKRRRKKG